MATKKSKTDRSAIGMPRKKAFFFMVTAEAIYTREEGIRKRTVNVMLQLDTTNITQSALFEAQKAVRIRLHAENGVEPGDIKDIIMLNIFPLAHTTEKEFHDVGTSNPNQRSH